MGICAEILCVAVGTPPDEDGHADLQYVLAMARSIGRHMDAPRMAQQAGYLPELLQAWKR